MPTMKNETKAHCGTCGVKYLIEALHSTLGNKQYLHDLEVLLSRLEPSPEEEETLLLLSRDLTYLEGKHRQKNTKLPY